jgi:DNA-binding NtrC family response regulator
MAMHLRRILVVEGNPRLVTEWKSILPRGFDVAVSVEGARLATLLHESIADLIILAPAPADAHPWVEIVRRFRRRDGAQRVALVARQGSEGLAVAALRAGLDDYFTHPISAEEIAAGIERCFGQASMSTRTGASAGVLNSVHALVGEGPRMREIKSYVASVAPTDSSVLITGETGTGKELVAELIHRSSPRAERPFVSINCAAIPDSLVESELFGYERGAFTGAVAQKEGALKRATGGSAFFDEIGDMTLYAQAKILRAIESREVQRLGGTRAVSLDIRVIAATNQDLESLIEERKFRSDLYFRINVARIHLPPLRERREDIPHLIHHYIGLLNARTGRRVEGLTDEALDALVRHDWPGNIRELRNVLEAIFVNLPPQPVARLELPGPLRQRLRLTADLPADERTRLLSALFATNWNKSRAAEKLHWSRMTLYRKLAKYRLLRSEDPDISPGDRPRPP